MGGDKDEVKAMKERLLHTPNQPGGFRTIPFIIANDSIEKVASFGLMPNMIIYLTTEYRMSMTTGASVLFIWSAVTNFLPVVGAFLADSFLGRFRTIGFGSFASLLGLILLWLTAAIPEARPLPCNEFSNVCESATTFQLTFLFSSFFLMSMGAGGVRSASLAFGADQLDKRDGPENKRALERFFAVYYASSMVSVLLALTCIVYIQDQFGWEVGFGIPVFLMFLSTLSFFLASPFYVKLKANSSLLTDFAQVLVVSFKNRHLELPSQSTDGLYHSRVDSELSMPSDTLRFLNKACIVRGTQQDLEQDKISLDPWTFCTVNQVEELKALIKIIPIWSTGIMMSVSINQSSFPVIQAGSMDRHITSNFEIPAGSVSTVQVISLVVWLVLLKRIILPLTGKIRGRPTRITIKQRLGTGLLLSSLVMSTTAIVESIRRRIAIEEGFLDNPQGVVTMSVMWLMPQYCISGVAEAFNFIAQTEFYYTEFPKTMSSIATALFGVGMSIANLVSSFVLNTVEDVTGGEGKDSWVSNNINRGHWDYYYWLLACLSLANFGYFVICSKAYGPTVTERNEARNVH